jgi:protein gp37
MEAGAWPLPNVWLGVSIENADYAHRADILRQIPAKVRFISYEPALGPLADSINLDGIHWVIYGGESGKGYRKEDKQWARDMRDKCKREGVAFFHKQSSGFRNETGIELDGEIIHEFPK